MLSQKKKKILKLGWHLIIHFLRVFFLLQSFYAFRVFDFFYIELNGFVLKSQRDEDWKDIEGLWVHCFE